ncbi:MAG: TauD/TfdA dioxygenase family protein [Actinomycetota bacterium]
MTTTARPPQTGTLTVDPVAGALGAEVRGVHLGSLTDAEFAAVHTALLEHLVLFFPDQHLTPDEHRSFAVRFGEPEIHPFIPKLDDDHPEIVVLEGTARADVWHTDVTFAQHPPICSVLKAVTMPTRGGDTMWTNQYAVYDALSTPMRDLLDGLTAVHWAKAFGHPEIRATHPAVRVHPGTGRRSLYVNRTFTSHFVELSPGESRALLEYLWTFSEQPQFTCRYRWSEGTIGIWDNRVTQHYAINDYADPRRIERVTIIGDVPEGNPPRWGAYDGPLSAYDLVDSMVGRAGVAKDDRSTH